MKLKNWLVVGLIFSTVGANAQDRREIVFEEYDLDNGIHVILHEDHSTPIVAVDYFISRRI